MKKQKQPRVEVIIRPMVGAKSHGRSKSFSLYETNLEEVVAIVESALEEAADEWERNTR